MVTEYGGNPASEPANSSGSQNGKSDTTPTAESAFLKVGSFSIDDAIAMHLVDCEQCRHAIEKMRPVGLGQKTGLCDAYLQLQLMRANYEGAANRIVAHTEYGDEAPKGGSLE